MGILTDYFVAADDAHAASAVHGPAGLAVGAPTSSAWPFVGERLAGVEPFVMLGALASVLIRRPYGEVTRHPRHGTVVASAGDEGPWVVTVSDELVEALASARRSALDRVAAEWAQTAVILDQEPAVLVDGLSRLAGLCARADESGQAVYCWTSL